jgi:putative flippase GtrA
MSDRENSRLGRWLAALASPQRFGRFVSVGVVGALFDVMVLLVLVESVGLLEEVAVVVGIETAILVMFTLNEGWTFRDAGRGGRWATVRRLVRSHAVRAAGSTVQFLVFVTVFRLLFVSVTVAGIDAWLLVAKAGGIACGMLVNYILETLFTWRVHAV